MNLIHALLSVAKEPVFVLYSYGVSFLVHFEFSTIKASLVADDDPASTKTHMLFDISLFSINFALIL